MKERGSENIHHTFIRDTKHPISTKTIISLSSEHPTSTKTKCQFPNQQIHSLQTKHIFSLFLSLSLSSLKHKPSASQIPIFIIVHSVSQSFHLHHFSFLSFLTFFSWMLAPLRKRISTTSPFPL